MIESSRPVAYTNVSKTVLLGLSALSQMYPNTGDTTIAAHMA